MKRKEKEKEKKKTCKTCRYAVDYLLNLSFSTGKPILCSCFFEKNMNLINYHSCKKHEVK